MTAPVADSTLSPEDQRMLAEHLEEAKRLREQYGDPTAYMASIVRRNFDQESLEEALREAIEGGSFWNDDELDER
jgi:hypothetical protein